jgi:cell division protein FtsZ
MLMGGGAFMSIGQGNGSNKALEAIDQALHHPLLESVSLEHATGMIVNFTGGKDLTLFEVDQAIKYLQEQANPDTEIVLGVIEDERMNNRVQAILVITGIGAPTLEEAFAMPSQPVRKPEPVAQSTETFNKPTTPTNRSRFISEVEIATADMSNLDVPAFLRRRQQQTR